MVRRRALFKKPIPNIFEDLRPAVAIPLIRKTETVIGSSDQAGSDRLAVGQESCVEQIKPGHGNISVGGSLSNKDAYMRFE